MAITLDRSPEFQDASAPDEFEVTVAQDAPEEVRRMSRLPRPSERAGAPVEPVYGRLLSVAQVALELGVSTRQVRRLIESGALRAKRVNPRLYQIRKADLKYVRLRPLGRPCKVW